MDVLIQTCAGFVLRLRGFQALITQSLRKDLSLPWPYFGCNQIAGREPATAGTGGACAKMHLVGTC